LEKLGIAKHGSEILLRACALGYSRHRSSIAITGLSSISRLIPLLRAYGLASTAALTAR
jgi:hypothetical protein